MKFLKTLFERKKPEVPPRGSFLFRCYKEILRNKLPIKYIANPERNGTTCGWLVFDKTLILLDVMVQYYSDIDQWYCCEFDGGHDLAVFLIDEYIQEQIKQINKFAGMEICQDAIVLVESNQIDNLEETVLEKRFLIYDGNRIDALRTFCEINGE